MLADPAWLDLADYQPFAILTMCRALYALEEGEMVSKPKAADWARRTLAEPWSSLIADALRWKPGEPFGRVPETLELIRYTLARADEVSGL